MKITKENKLSIKNFIKNNFKECLVTQRRLQNNVFEKFIGRELVIEDNIWYIK